MKKKSKKITEETINIVMAGIEDSGKSSILNAIKGDSIKNIPKTYGFDISNIKMKNKYLNIYDLGGSQDQRQYWNCYIDSCDALIYVIDCSNQEKFEEAGKWLNFLLEEIQLEEIPVAVFFNKIDKKNSFDVKYMTELLELSDIDDREWKCFGVSALTGEGILGGFEWVFERVV